MVIGLCIVATSAINTEMQMDKWHVLAKGETGKWALFQVQAFSMLDAAKQALEIVREGLEIVQITRL